MPLRDFEIPLSDTQSGEIHYTPPFTYNISKFSDGEETPRAGKEYTPTGTQEFRTFFSFDTSSLATEGWGHSDILRVRLFPTVSIIFGSLNILDWIHRAHIDSDWIGNPPGTGLHSSDFAQGATLSYQEVNFGAGGPGTNPVYEFDSSLFTKVSLNGLTDIMIRDLSTEDPANSDHWVVFSHTKPGNTRLVVTLQGAVEFDTVFYNLGG